MSNKSLLIKNVSIQRFLYDNNALSIRGHALSIGNDRPLDQNNINDFIGCELFYIASDKGVKDGDKITFEIDDAGRKTNREFVNNRVFIAKKYDDISIMLVFEGDNINDPIEL